MKIATLVAKRHKEVTTEAHKIELLCGQILGHARVFNSKLRAYNAVTDGDNVGLDIEDAVDIIREIVKNAIP